MKAICHRRLTISSAGADLPHPIGLLFFKTIPASHTLAYWASHGPLLLRALDRIDRYSC